MKIGTLIVTAVSFSCFALGLFAPVHAATVPISSFSPWTEVGANPCEGRCTGETMLAHLKDKGWPPEAIAYFQEQFKVAEAKLSLGHAPEDIDWTRMDLSKGWSGAVSFGDNNISSYSVAWFEEAEAYGFAYEQDGVVYRLRWVRECTNLAADSSRLIPPADDLIGWWYDYNRPNYQAQASVISGGAWSVSSNPSNMFGDVFVSKKFVDVIVNYCFICQDQPTNGGGDGGKPPVIPLPATAFMLLGGLCALTGLAAYKRRPRRA